jgi:hypothetical protein
VLTHYLVKLITENLEERLETESYSRQLRTVEP